MTDRQRETILNKFHGLSDFMEKVKADKQQKQLVGDPGFDLNEIITRLDGMRKML